MDYRRVLLLAVVTGLAIPLIAATKADNSSQPSQSKTLLVTEASALHQAVMIEMETKVPAEKQNGEERNLGNDSAADKHEIEATLRKLQETIIPKVEFHDIRVSEAVDFLSKETGLPILSIPFDPPEKSTVSSRTVFQPAQGDSMPEDVSGTLSLTNASAAKVLRHVAALSSHFARIEPGVVALTPTRYSEGFPTNTYYVPKYLAGIFSKSCLESKGVTFPPGSGIGYNPSTELLTVRNSLINFAFIEDILDDLLLPLAKERQIEVEKQADRELQGSLEWKQKVATMVVRNVEIQNATMEEVIRGLRSKLTGWIGAKVDPNVRITLSMKNCSVPDMLGRIADLAKSRAVIGSYVVVFVPTESTLR